MTREPWIECRGVRSCGGLHSTIDEVGRCGRRAWLRENPWRIFLIPWRTFTWHLLKPLYDKNGEFRLARRPRG